MLFYESNHSSGYDTFLANTTANLDFAAHFHRAFEMIDVQSGQITVTIGQNRFDLTAGDAILTLPDEIHAYHTADHSLCRILIFSEDHAHSAYTTLKGKALADPVFHIDARIREYLFDTLLDTNTTRLHRKACLSLICAEALRQSPLVDRDRKEEALLYKIITFVQGNFTQDLTLRDVAKQFGYDYSYLSRYLNRFLHMSFADFLNGCRISYAAALLSDASMKITEVARLCGYENVRTFNRNFLRVHHCTPREFRAERP